MQPPDDFEHLAKNTRDGSVLGELWAFIRINKKYWLLPIIAVLLILGMLVLLSGTAIGPFIYTVF